MFFLNVYCRPPALSSTHDVNINISIDDVVDDGVIQYLAAAPPDYKTSYSGSGLPFHSYEQAFHNTPNKGSVVLSGNEANISLVYPNSFYMALGTVIVPPTVYLFYTSGGIQKEKAIKLSDGVPYRLLSYPMKFTKARENVMFYDGIWQLPVRTQEEILRDAGFPAKNKMANNFWGLKPPV